MVNIFYEETEILDLDPEFFRLWLGELCALYGRTLEEVSLIFGSDEYVLKMNMDHLNHEFYTDIITFDYCNDKLVAGDLFVSVDRVRDNAKSLGEMFHVELNRVVAHGVLHLLGFNDKSVDEQKVMRAEEARALSLIVSRET